jgi:50S ribosomal protein L16 3-hydroxylase
MHPETPLPLLGGLSPAQFMRRHWQKKPLVVRQAWPGAPVPASRAQLMKLAESIDVESRLVAQTADGWSLKRGPLARRSLPPLRRPRWTLLVQGLDLHVPAAHAMLSHFAFLPYARLDDLMVSWASDGGGVGPHVDDYDVFLIQLQGRRRWRLGRVPDPVFVEGVPLKILRNFEPDQDLVLEPGDLLYLPPRWGHDGIADGECMTASVGFKVPDRAEVARELLLRLADGIEGDADKLYTDPDQPATVTPGRVPAKLVDFAAGAMARVLKEPDALPRALGEWLTEPKPQVWFDVAGDAAAAANGVRLDARSRMLYDDRHVYLNGDAWRTAGRDARLLQTLADKRRLDAAGCGKLSGPARDVLGDWLAAGWLHALP